MRGSFEIPSMPERNKKPLLSISGKLFGLDINFNLGDESDPVSCSYGKGSVEIGVGREYIAEKARNFYTEFSNAPNSEEFYKQRESEGDETAEMINVLFEKIGGEPLNKVLDWLNKNFSYAESRIILRKIHKFEPDKITTFCSFPPELIRRMLLPKKEYSAFSQILRERMINYLKRKDKEKEDKEKREKKKNGK